MRRALRLVVIAGAGISLSACGTSYKVPISTAKISEQASKVGTHVSVAKSSSQTASKRTDRNIVRIVKASESAQTIAQHLDAALKLLDALQSKDTVAIVAHILAAKGGVNVLIYILGETQEELKQTKSDLDIVAKELGGAQIANETLKLEVKAVQKKADEAAITAAEDAEIARRCRSFFGLGAIFYGVERLVKTGIIGIIIIILAVVVLGFVAKFASGPVGLIASGGVNGAKGLWTRWRQRKRETAKIPPPAPIPPPPPTVVPPAQSHQPHEPPA